MTTGIASVASQLVFVREYLSQFQGNEMVIALVLFFWLILGGIGTRLAHRCGAASAATLVNFSLCLAVLAIVQIICVRLLRPVVFLQAESVGFYSIVGFTALTMAPYAMLVGFVLPYSLYVLREQYPDFPSVSIYMADNFGDICGGALFAFCLVFWATPMQALAIANAPLVFAAACLSPRRGVHLALVLASAAVLITGVVVEMRLLKPGAGQLVHYEESRYARLTVRQDRSQITLFADGRPLVSNQSAISAEMHAHYPLSQVDQARRILFVSAVGGLTNELSKYHPDAIDYIELDPVAARLVNQFKIMPAIKGLRIIQADARTWLRTHNLKYDAILINLDEPATYQLNRFFTDRFFELVKGHLNPQGVFSFGVDGFANYPTPAQQQKISILWRTVQRHFRHVEILPGERIVFLCKQQPIDLDIPKRLQSLAISTQYAGPYFDGNITPGRIDQLRRLIDHQAPINTDDRPCLMRVIFDQWFTKFGTSPTLFWLALIGCSTAYIVRLKREEYVLFATGLTTMGSEILVIFAFQIYLGYIYFKIGILVTVFLSGMLPGAWLGKRWTRRSSHGLLISDLFLIAFVGAFILALQLGGDALPQGFYYAGGFLLSFAGGFQFPLALAELGDSRKFATRIFAVDLVGAACGALLVSTVLIPFLGLIATGGILSGIKLTSFLLLGQRHVLRS